MAILLKKKTATPAQQGAPAKSPAPGKKVDAFASKFNAVVPTDKGTYIPPDPGRYQGLITGGELINDPEKGISVYFETTITDEGDFEHKKTRTYFNLFGPDEEELPGCAFFKRTVQMFGLTDEITSMQDVEDFIASTVEAKPWVVIDVKRNGKYTNVYINELLEDQDSKPEIPD